MSATPEVLTNWSGNHAYAATEVHRPESLDALRRIAAAAPSLHAIASRHVFTGMGDAAALVAFDAWPEAAAIEIDRDAMTVTVGPAVTYARLAEALNAASLALDNLASLPHISVAGAIATATHGSGDGLGNLATAVAGLTLVTSTGDVEVIGDDDPRLPGVTVHLGALGIVTAVTLRVVPYYELRQDVYDGLEWEALFQNLDAVFAAGRSVSVFHGLGERARMVWVKGDADRDVPAALFGARAATEPRHPIPGQDATNCTEQLGVPGPWSERLPHFRSGFLPSRGIEVQSEAFVDRADAEAAIRAILAVGPELAEHLLCGELRVIAADELWLSPHHGRDTLGLHFTWRRDADAVRLATETIEGALAPLSPRVHWGKAFAAGPEQLTAAYPRLGEFAALRAQLDPRGAFANDWLRERLPGALASA